ncbi:hypothetical protein HKD37_12G033622 [Glycine soja]
MLKVCIEEVNARNKPHNHFTKLDWANIAEKFNKATNLRYEYKQFRNRNDNYGLSLLGRRQVLAEMGRRKPLQLEDPEIAKFREQDLEFSLEMKFLFKGTIATSFVAYAPSKDSRQYEGFNTRTE